VKGHAGIGQPGGVRTAEQFHGAGTVALGEPQDAQGIDDRGILRVQTSGLFRIARNSLRSGITRPL